MTIIYFIRHAKPNLEIHDDALRPLSDTGLKDCQKLIPFFENCQIDAIYSSPFKRAYDTVAPLAASHHLPLTTVDNFRERKVSDQWLEDFNGFCFEQWHDFSYKLENGEALSTVQNRNIRALNDILAIHNNQTIVIGTHGTALSTIINYYDQSFDFEAFNKIKQLMPWIVKFTFDTINCLQIDSFDIFDKNAPSYSRDFCQ